MEQSKNLRSKQGLLAVSGSCKSLECLLIATAVSYKTTEGFSGREKNILLPLHKTVTGRNAECLILVCLA